MEPLLITLILQLEQTGSCRPACTHTHTRKHFIKLPHVIKHRKVYYQVMATKILMYDEVKKLSATGEMEGVINFNLIHYLSVFIIHLLIKIKIKI